MALAITKSYAAGSILTEAMIDNFRTGLHTLFNTTKFDSSQFVSTMALTSAHFAPQALTETDDTYILFGTDSDGILGLDASKNLVFDTLGDIPIQFVADAWTLEMKSTYVNVPGDIIIGSGGADRTILQILSLYKKPVLEWYGASQISISANTNDSSETMLVFPSFVAAVDETLSSSAKFRQASITTTANGYGAADTGAAKGGRRSGLSLTNNNWYPVYACKVRSGDDYSATLAKFVLVFEDTLPYSENEATLDGRYGEGNWVYMGIIRYGYGATGSTSTIIKFKYSNKGWCYFCGTDTGSTQGGLTLYQSTLDADNSAAACYTLVNGLGNAEVPDLAGHIQVLVRRAKVSDWYIKDSAGLICWRGGWQTADTTLSHGFLIELPYVTESTCYSFFQVRKGTGAVDKRVCLTGFCDGLIGVRRQGKGV